MRKLCTLLTALFLFVYPAKSQTSNITGSVSDSHEHKPVHNAVIALLTHRDSVLYKYTRSDAQGKYKFSNVAPGDYILMTTHPYFADLMDNVAIRGDVQLPDLALLSKAKLLQEIIVTTGSPIKIKGDTTIYTADSFKVSANANVEELLKKLPGIQVDKDGKIKAMGETVQKVLVDGEEFFGDDPGMAVKNLRADAVKEVQVFDKKSDQAEFTGIADGNTQKTINLKLKEDKKIGYFGKMDASGGLQKNIPNRYNTNLMLSSFKGKRKISGFLLKGNTGQDGLSWQDEQKYGGADNTISMNEEGDIMMIGRGGTSDDEPYLDPQNGYMTSINSGISYNNKWNDKHTLTFAPKYNKQEYDNRRQSFTRTQIEDSVLNDKADVVTHINRNNYKNRLIYDLKLDSNNSLKVIANANFYHTESVETRTSESRGGTGALKNLTNRFLQVASDKSAYSGSMIFRHRFKKLRRTLSLSADWNSQGTEGINYLQSQNQSFFNGQAAGKRDLDQMKDYELASNNVSAKIIYTEPLNKQLSLELAYQLGLTSGNNHQITYNYTPASGKFDSRVDSLSNEFTQKVIQQVPSAKINFSNKKYKINFGSGFGITDFKLVDVTYNKNYTRNFINFFPNANIHYTYKPNHTIRLNYTGSTRQPTINQLQPLRNNNDYFNQYIGNPDLKPSFTNSINISHNRYNFIKDVFMYASINARITSNQISNNRIINKDSAKTTSQPINTNGNYSVGFYGGTGYKLKKLDIRLNINPNLNYSHYVAILNSAQLISNDMSAGLSVGLSKSKEKKYDVSLNNEFSYTRNVNSQNNSKIHYTQNTISLNSTIYIRKVWSVVTDYRFFLRQQISEFNKALNNHVWNGRLQRTFKNDEFTAYIMVRDILNQNVGIQRSFSLNTYSEQVNDRLQRYFMIGFTWDFKNKAPKPKTEP